MKTLILYDSNYGNTQQIAEAMAAELSDSTAAINVKDCNVTNLHNIDLLIVGSPINGWKPSPRMLKFLSQLPKYLLDGIQAATFDTRIKAFFHGDAANKIAHRLEIIGAEIIAEPMAFYVTGTEGPLMDGEIERAKDWIHTVAHGKAEPLVRT